MKELSYARIYKSQEYLASLGTIHYRSLFGGYSLTVGDTVFAMVANGELYLRACEQSAQYCVQNSPVWLTFIKRGRPLVLNYYRERCPVAKPAATGVVIAIFVGCSG